MTRIYLYTSPQYLDTMKPLSIEETEIVRRLFEKPEDIKLSELTVLGMLSHNILSGYDIYKRLSKKLDWIGSYLNLNKATVYNTIARLEKEGLIELAEKVTEEKKPTKYLYTITDSGIEHLKSMLVMDTKNFPFIISNTYFDLMFYHHFDKEEIRELVELRIKQMELLIELLRVYLPHNKGNIFELLFESELRIYEEMLSTSRKLLRIIDEKPIDELYKMRYVFDGEKPPEIYELFNIQR